MGSGEETKMPAYAGSVKEKPGRAYIPAGSICSITGRMEAKQRAPTGALMLCHVLALNISSPLPVIFTFT
jgi:hypothetical protein